MGKLKPEPFNLDDPTEVARLFRELEGYMQVSLNHGTDTKGRRYAYEAIKALNTRQGVLVPVEPTEEMIEAGEEAIRDTYDIDVPNRDYAVAAYKAMIQALQSSDSGEGK